MSNNVINVDNDYELHESSLHNSTFIICNKQSGVMNVSLPSNCNNNSIGSVILIKNISNNNVKLTTHNYLERNDNKYIKEMLVRPKNYVMVTLISPTTYSVFI